MAHDRAALRCGLELEPDIFDAAMAQPGAPIGGFEANAAARFDLIFADSWPGKFTHLDLALGLLAPGGFYVVDDLRPQPTWPRGHEAAVEAFVSTLSQRPDLTVTFLPWASGVAMATRPSRAR